MSTKANEPGNFLDSKTLLALGLTIAFFFGWRWFMEKQNPVPPGAPIPSSAAQTVAPSAAQATAQSTAQSPIQPNAQPGSAASAKAETFSAYDSPELSFELSSRGMGLRRIDIKKYRSRSNEPILLGVVRERLPFATEFVEGNEPIDFIVEKSGENEFVGRAMVNGMAIEKRMKLTPSLYSFDVDVKVNNPVSGFRGLQTTLSDVLVDPKSSAALVPNYDHQDFFYHHNGGKTKRALISKEKGADVSESNVSLIALSSHYFTMAIVDSKTLLPRFVGKAAAGGSEATGRLVYEPINRADTFSIRYKGYAGPKSFEVFDQVDPDLATVIDYGMFGMLGKPLWQLLKLCYSLVGNYGVAIILMTLVVRFCVLPFNIYSFRSMKAMQRIQPQITALKARLKDDPRAMNAEVMGLMKTNKANPLGGCLPVLLQLPIFFALYQVLGQSIELYRAPFVLWIQDLSMSDRYYVLPVLMAGSMFAQQKITPTAMDPAQAKIMMWMPLLFAFFMLSLPSGLTLYILVSTLFGITQQLVFARDRRAQAGVVDVKALPVK